jgi:membrane-anchored protein YejM (alkaline phosphatase superfamily)
MGFIQMGNEKVTRKNRRIKLGIFLLLFSGVFFAATLIFPLTQLPVKTKVIASTTSLILMEIVFWTGGLLVGKELFTRYKRKLNPVTWFKKSSSSPEEKLEN